MSAHVTAKNAVKAAEAIIAGMPTCKVCKVYAAEVDKLLRRLEPKP